MDAEQSRRLEPRLRKYLGRFDDCLARGDTRAHLPVYICGQLSNLERKSVEPIALDAGVPVRTLQEFLSQHRCDHVRMRDWLQPIVRVSARQNQGRVGGGRGGSGAGEECAGRASDQREVRRAARRAARRWWRRLARSRRC
jgi:hypothetical protein